MRHKKGHFEMMNVAIAEKGAQPEFLVNQTVLVAQLRIHNGKPSCVPVTKKIVAVGLNTLMFEDGTDQFKKYCFHNSPEGLTQCKSWCLRVELHNEAFKWPISTPT